MVDLLSPFPPIYRRHDQNYVKPNNARVQWMKRLCCALAVRILFSWIVVLFIFWLDQDYSVVIGDLVLSAMLTTGFLLFAILYALIAKTDYTNITRTNHIYFASFFLNIPIGLLMSFLDDSLALASYLMISPLSSAFLSMLCTIQRIFGNRELHYRVGSSAINGLCLILMVFHLFIIMFFLIARYSQLLYL